MRLAVLLCTLLSVPTLSAAGLDPEMKTAYQLRVVLRFGEHPTFTKAFRGDVRKEVLTALQTGLGLTGSVEVVDLADLALELRDPITRVVADKGLEGLDTVNAVVGGKTHYVHVDFHAGKYELRARQHDGTCGFVTPIIRLGTHADRTFVGRVAGLLIAQDFGLVGTLDPTGADQVSLPLKGGELSSLESWVKKGDVFAVVQIRENKRVRPKSKDGKPVPVLYGTRLEGVLLQVVERPTPTSVVVCKVHNRYQGALPRDANTVGYRCVKLGTSDAPVKLQLTNASGAPFKDEEVQVRAGSLDYPMKDREGSELAFKDGLFTSKENFGQIAFLMVRSGEAPVARIPIEVYAEQVVTRKIVLNPKNAGRSYFMEIAGDLIDRIRNARVTQASSFDEITTLQKTDKQKALDLAQRVFTLQRKDIDGLKSEVIRLQDRFGKEAPPGSFDACQKELQALEQRANQLSAHVQSLKDIIRLENDPNVIAQRKALDNLLFEAESHLKKADYDQALAKYEEALKQAEMAPPGDRAKIQALYDTLKKAWTPKDAEHATARQFIYETWPKLDKAPDVRDKLPEARRAFEKCKAVGDKMTLTKMALVSLQVSDNYFNHLKMLTDSAMEDEEKQALEGYPKVTEDLIQLVTDIGTAVGADRAPEKKP